MIFFMRADYIGNAQDQSWSLGYLNFKQQHYEIYRIRIAFTVPGADSSG